MRIVVFELTSPRAQYHLEYDTKFTLVGGDSGTGKSYLCELAVYAYRKYAFVGCHSDLPFVSLSCFGTNWTRDLARVEHSLVILDESKRFLRTPEFISAALDSTNYYILMTREPFPQIPSDLKRHVVMRNGRLVPDPNLSLQVYLEDG